MILWFSLGFLGILILGGVFLKLKHRILWRELWKVKGELRNVENKLVSLRKEQVLLEVKGTLRLPPLMPSQNGEELLLWTFFDKKRNGFYRDWRL